MHLVKRSDILARLVNIVWVRGRGKESVLIGQFKPLELMMHWITDLGVKSLI